MKKEQIMSVLFLASIGLNLLWGYEKLVKGFYAVGIQQGAANAQKQLSENLMQAMKSGRIDLADDNGNPISFVLEKKK